VGKSTVELYCDLDGLQAPGGGLILADIMVQEQRPDLAIIDRSMHDRHKIALVKLTCPWDTDADRARASNSRMCILGILIGLISTMPVTNAFIKFTKTP
jgi:hypothetical protein